MKRKFTVDKPDTLVRYLSDELIGVPRDRIKIQLKRGEIKINGVKAQTDAELGRGDEVEIFLPVKFDVPEIPVVYEDDNIIIADKPPFVESEHSLPKAILEIYGKKVCAAHRLDTNTTGLIILCKSENALSAVISSFAAKQIKKTYYARVFGCPDKNEDTLKAYIVKNSEKSFCKIVTAAERGAKEIITEYKVISRGEQSNLSLNPVTGRTHQLRAHLAFIGCPIVGDGKYGNEKKNREAGAKIQKLRAVCIEFGKMSEPLRYLSGKKFCANESRYMYDTFD